MFPFHSTGCRAYAMISLSIFNANEISMTQLPPPVITVDGAGGTGKGTVSHLLAKRLGWHVLDSGVLYRILAFAAQQEGIVWDNPQNEALLAELALNLEIKFLDKDADLPRLILKGEDVTEAIRTEKIGNGASIVGAYPAVRTALLDRQRAFRILPGLVADGRDMGTVVFPDAVLKVFLTASAEERAARRYKQLKAQGRDVTLERLIAELFARDSRDQARAVAPLKPAVDALRIDTDHLTVQEVVEVIVKAFPVTLAAEKVY